MAPRLRRETYHFDDRAFDGAVAVDDDVTAGGGPDGTRPAVLVFHGWEGRSSAQEAVAVRLAGLGYVGVACDLFGGGLRGEVGGDNSALIAPLLQDRALLRRRLWASLDFARDLPEVDPSRVAAIGFCFGGLCVLDLARSGASVQGVASFHGVLTAPTDPPTSSISASIAVFHGWDDPMAPPDDVVALARELSEAGADWQIHAYGSTMHAFMAEGVDQPERGLRYNERSARRAWSSLERFLAEVLRDAPAGGA